MTVMVIHEKTLKHSPNSEVNILNYQRGGLTVTFSAWAHGVNKVKGSGNRIGRFMPDSGQLRTFKEN